MVVCNLPLRTRLRADVAMLGIEIAFSFSRVCAPDERTIEHGCHGDQHDADDAPGLWFGSRCRLFAFTIARCSRNALEMAAPGCTPRRGRDWKDPCPHSARAGQFLPDGSVLERPEPHAVRWRGRDTSNIPGSGETSVSLRT